MKTILASASIAILSLITMGSSFASSGYKSFYDDKICQRIKKEMKPRNGQLFAISDGELVHIKRKTAVENVNRSTLYYYRSRLRGRGGVLSVKVGYQSNKPNVKIYPLRQTRKFDEVRKRIISNCLRNKDIRKRLRRIGLRNFTFKEYQNYVRRPGGRISDDRQRQAAIFNALENFHFYYDPNVTRGDVKHKIKCKYATNKGRNRVHNSLRFFHTRSLFENAFASLIRDRRHKVEADLSWHVRLLPYQIPQNREGRSACIALRLPLSSKPKFFRINDFEERARSTFGTISDARFGDRQWPDE